MGSRSNGVVTVDVLGARSLKGMDFLGKNDPYAVVHVGRQSQKTRTMKNAGASCTWNQVFHYDLPSDIKEISVEVFDEDRFKKDDFIGVAVIYVDDLISRGGALEGWFPLKGARKRSTGEVHLSLKHAPPGQASLLAGKHQSSSKFREASLDNPFASSPPPYSESQKDLFAHDSKRLSAAATTYSASSSSKPFSYVHPTPSASSAAASETSGMPSWAQGGTASSATDQALRRSYDGSPSSHSPAYPASAFQEPVGSSPAGSSALRGPAPSSQTAATPTSNFQPSSTSSPPQGPPYGSPQQGSPYGPPQQGSPHSSLPNPFQDSQQPTAPPPHQTGISPPPQLSAYTSPAQGQSSPPPAGQHSYPPPSPQTSQYPPPSPASHPPSSYPPSSYPPSSYPPSSYPPSSQPGYPPPSASSPYPAAPPSLMPSQAPSPSVGWKIPMDAPMTSYPPMPAAGLPPSALSSGPYPAAGSYPPPQSPYHQVGDPNTIVVHTVPGTDQDLALAAALISNYHQRHGGY